MGASRWFFSLSGRDPAGRRPRARDQAAQLRHRLRVGNADQGRAGEADRRGRRPRKRSTRGVTERGGPAGVRPRSRRQRLPDPGQDPQPGEIKERRARSKRSSASAPNGFDSTSVGPTFGQQVANSARNALIFSLLVICAYVAFRFDPKFAVPVLIALFHDILITAGVYSLTGREVTSGTVAAFLTILGYSLYDTIIVFDRIRENMPRMPRAAFSQIVNRSMSEVLTRSLATSFSTLLAVGVAARLRRRDAAGLRLRDAGRDRLRDLLVDLHRLAGADRLEGTRARLRAPARADRRGRRARARVRRRRRAGQARRRRRERSARSRARVADAREAQPTPAPSRRPSRRRRRRRRRAAGQRRAADADGVGGAPREQRASAARRRQQRRKHGRNR